VEWQAYRLLCGMKFRRWSAAGAFFWALQYCLLGAWTAGLTMGVTAVRTLYSSYSHSQSKVLKHRGATLFVLLFCLLTAISWQGYISLLPAFAVINTTLALFYFKNRLMRTVLIASSAAWILNDLYWRAWPALLAETVAVGINARTIWRLSINK
jgi:hypothetical protein